MKVNRLERLFFLKFNISFLYLLSLSRFCALVWALKKSDIMIRMNRECLKQGFEWNLPNVHHFQESWPNNASSMLILSLNFGDFFSLIAFRYFVLTNTKSKITLELMWWNVFESEWFRFVSFHNLHPKAKWKLTIRKNHVEMSKLKINSHNFASISIKSFNMCIKNLSLVTAHHILCTICIFAFDSFNLFLVVKANQQKR